MNRGTSRRTSLWSAAGDSSVPSVVHGNVFLARTASFDDYMCNQFVAQLCLQVSACCFKSNVI